MTSSIRCAEKKLIGHVKALMGLTVLLKPPVYAQDFSPPDFSVGLENIMGLVQPLVKFSLILLGIAVFAGTALIFFRHLTYWLVGHKYQSPSSIEDTQITKNKENDQIQTLLSLKRKDMNRQIADVLNKFEKVHKRYQSHLDISYRRSEFYHGDVPLIAEYIATYRKMESFDKKTLDELASTMKTYERKLDDIHGVFDNKLKMKLLTLSDVIRAKSR